MLGEIQEAMISWFFSLAHELAHNAVADHNSEHEVCPLEELLYGLLMVRE